MSQVSTNALPILMYHEVGSEDELAALGSVMQRNYLTGIEALRRHLQVLRESGASTVSMSRLRQWQLGLGDLPERPVVITFDDGFAGNYRYAMPMLLEYGFTATFFVISGRVGTRHMMSWQQLVELRNAGAEIGSHTASHTLMSTLTERQTVDELVTSRAVLEDGLGAKVEHFAVPFGDRNTHYSTAMQTAGYVTGATSEVGLAERDTHPHQLPRFSMTSNVNENLLKQILLQDDRAISRITRHTELKRRVSRLLGKRNYERLASLVYGVKLKPGERLD